MDMCWFVFVFKSSTIIVDVDEKLTDFYDLK